MDEISLYWRQHKAGAGVFVLFSLIFFSSFALYHLPLKAVLYPVLICGLLGSVFILLDMIRCIRRHRYLRELTKLPAELIDSLPQAASMEEADYQRLIVSLRTAQKQLKDQMNQRYSDMVDYYTIWAHQIKTPIASMRLNLQNEDSPLSRKIQADLLRIEQYVEMVLTFLRLDSDSTDYVIREYALDDIIKQAVRRYAGQFIGRRISLKYEPVGVSVVTDEKWLLFVLEQVLGNALKYTPEGGTVTIDMEGERMLCIRDTGIGIAPEDIPRIFEKGYTGYNGRSDKKASGIGLYLCRRICNNLRHEIGVNSSPGSGTVVRLRFR
ncbi:MAG: HAMP domain-containing histidine kinase [Lachnospiraceae bacterium]|nr:HAMP domain-containing histidine kinase [Lachnospiraceae bacterium]